MATATLAPTKIYEVTELAINGLAIKEHPGSEIKPHQVRVKVHAVSLNFRDLMIVKGTYNPRIALPFTPCSDGSGEVIEVGSDVTLFKVGDRVMAAFMPDWVSGRLNQTGARSALGVGNTTGMLAETVVLPEHGLVRIPEHLSYEEAATLPCAAVTAWNTLIETGNLRAGETVLTLGTGGVSLFAIQFAL